MQGKGIIKFFLIVMTVVCVVQYLFILPTRGVERRADEYAASVAAKVDEAERYAVEKEARTAYLDSMSSEEVFSIPMVKSYTYEELKRQQLALGLDLKGGMSVVLQVDLKEFIQSLSNNSKDPTFLAALDNASERLRETQSDYVTLFGEEFAKIADGKTLSQIFTRNPALRDQINFETPDSEVLTLVRKRADETVDLTFKRLKDRIDKFGVTQPNVSLDAARDLIIVELPGIDNPERVRSYLGTTAKLEFWRVYRVSDAGILDAFVAADERLAKARKGAEVEEEPEYYIDTTWTEEFDSLGNVLSREIARIDSVEVETDPLLSNGPLLSVLNLNASNEALTFPLSVMGMAERNKTKAISGNAGERRHQVFVSKGYLIQMVKKT